MTRAGNRWLPAAAAVTTSIACLDALAVPCVLGAMRGSLHLAPPVLEWIVLAYNLALAVVLRTGAALVEVYDSRRVFVLAQGALALSSAGCALAPGGGWLIGACAAQGASIALALAALAARLAASRGAATRAPAYVLAAVVATSCGPLLGVLLAHGAAWRWLFWIDVPAALTALGLAAGWEKQEPGPPRALDFGEALLLAGGGLALLWALVRGGSSGWRDGSVLAALAVGVVLLGVFIAGGMPLGQSRVREFVAPRVAVGCAAAALYGAAFLLPPYLDTSFGGGPPALALRLAPWSAGLLLSVPLGAVLTGRVCTRFATCVGLVAAAAGLGAPAVLGAAPGYPPLVLPLLIGGCGTALALGAARPGRHPLASAPETLHLDAMTGGQIGPLRSVGAALGVSVLGAFLVGHADPAAAAPPAAHFAPALAAAAVIAAVGAAAAVAIPCRRPGAPSDLGTTCPRCRAEFQLAEQADTLDPQAPAVAL